MNLKLALYLVTLCITSGRLFQTQANSLPPSSPDKIESTLRQRYSQHPTSKYTVIVHMRNGPEATDILSQPDLQREKYATRGAHISALVSALEKHSAASQSRVSDHLDGIQASERQAGNSKLEYTPIWMSNKMIVKNVDLPMCEKLAAVHDEIEAIRENRIHLQPPGKFENSYSNSKDSASNSVPRAWGVHAIRAPEVWRTLQNSGEGIVVATADSGVNVNHVTLKDNYVGGPYGWFDPITSTVTPSDDGGHGTHTMGTLVGRGGIGVAPNATWMTCKSCEDGRCPTSALLSCFQYMVCPTLVTNSTNDGKEHIERDCSKAPHVFSSSIGDVPNPDDDPLYYAELSALRAAGIISVFAIGNSGAKCGTANEPGGFDNVIGVGSTDIDGHLAKSSSCGSEARVDLARPKPDCTAPGVKIVSASNVNNTGYTIKNGTSMACPHVAGVVALMLSKNPNLRFEEVRDIIYTSVVRQQGQMTILGNSTSPKCGNPTLSNERYPNNCEGWGIIDALNCVTNTKNQNAITV